MNVKGKVGVDYLKWTEDQLDSIRQSDVSWGVYLCVCISVCVCVCVV